MTGINGFGTTLTRGNGATPEVFTSIAGITNIGGPGISRETIDVSGHDSPDAYREFIASLKDAGEISLDLNYNPSKHDTLIDDFDDDDPKNYKLVFPEGTEWAIKALITNFEPSAPFDDKLSASVTLKVSGKPVITPGA